MLPTKSFGASGAEFLSRLAGLIIVMVLSEQLHFAEASAAKACVIVEVNRVETMSATANTFGLARNMTFP
jgi:hypothetical protein